MRRARRNCEEREPRRRNRCDPDPGYTNLPAGGVEAG